MADRLTAEERARQVAVTIVDGVHGYTCEFAPSPREHEIEYNIAQEHMAEAIRAAEEAAREEERELCAELADAEANAAKGSDPWTVANWISRRIRQRGETP